MGTFFTECYFDDNKIHNTEITYYDANGQRKIVTKFYNDYDFQNYSKDIIAFKATARSGYEFSHWVYRKGYTYETVRTSTNNPFYYIGGADGKETIYIRAVGKLKSGGDISSDWEIAKKNLGTVSEAKAESLTIEQGTIYRYKMIFSGSGNARFYTDSSAVDLRAYLSDESTYDEETGIPGRWTSNDVWEDYYLAADNISGSSNDFDITYSVTGGKTYYLWVRAQQKNSIGSTTVYITSPPKRIREWQWLFSNGSASDDETVRAWFAYNKAGGYKRIYDFSHLVWNDIADKVKEVIDETGGNWLNTYGDYQSTKMTVSDKVLTARRFNSLRYNVGARTGIEEKHYGETVYGQYFELITNALNAWINSIYE